MYVRVCVYNSLILTPGIRRLMPGVTPNANMTVFHSYEYTFALSDTRQFTANSLPEHVVRLVSPHDSKWTRQVLVASKFTCGQQALGVDASPPAVASQALRARHLRSVRHPTAHAGRQLLLPREQAVRRETQRDGDRLGKTPASMPTWGAWTVYWTRSVGSRSSSHTQVRLSPARARESVPGLADRNK